MKTYILTSIIAIVGVAISYADSKFVAHSDAAAHEAIVAPNGGRMIQSVDPHFEFLVTSDRFVQITFIAHDGSVVPVGEQTISLIGGSRSAPTKLNFVAKKGVLVSTEALPDMPNMPVVLQIKTSDDAKAVREKFKINMSSCGSCSYLEYACICGH